MENSFYIGIIFALSSALLISISMSYMAMRLLFQKGSSKTKKFVPHVPISRNGEKFKPIANDDETLFRREMEARRNAQQSL